MIWSTDIPTEPGKYVVRIDYNGAMIFPTYLVKVDRRGRYWFLGKDITKKLRSIQQTVEWAKEE